ncbi:MAG TPA: protein translocase subunit SecD [Gammaproteobacteria bacterium]|nr:protein translocase subunit SecD [Gammaproteobacteria bacterium]
MNQYPLWKYLLILAVLLLGLLYAAPNLYGKDPAVLVSPIRAQELDNNIRIEIEDTIKRAGVTDLGMERVNGKMMIRFKDSEDQLKASVALEDALSGRFVVAQNLAAATPDWLRVFGAKPMYLGLDLQGGIHFLMEVDMDAALAKEEERYIGDIKTQLRENKIRHIGVTRSQDYIRVRFRDAATRDKAMSELASNKDLVLTAEDNGADFFVLARLTEVHMKEVKKFALQQNMTTLRNRVNELGVAEPIIQKQGDSRIIVQLPGVQDPAQAKELLGATATLELRLVDERNLNVAQYVSSGRAPAGTRLYKRRNGQPILLSRRVIITGDYITHASSGFDSRSSSPAVYINLDDKGAKRFSNFTKDHIKDSMAVVYIETKNETRIVAGKKTRVKRRIEEVINVATIQERLSKRFQISGLDTPAEAHNLAILLRAGALAAPMEIIEERTVGPSLGKDNIEQGFESVLIGFALVLVFMAVYYKFFGLVANLALTFNLIIIVALLSLLQATLTLPGIAGIVLTVGMAVDANVLIFERIREELGIGNSVQASIHSGYEKAFSTIADANVTTLIAAIVLFSFGSGPVKGFAVTLSLGILTSMFTAIMGTRAVINLYYGRKRVKSLSI